MQKQKEIRNLFGFKSSAGAWRTHTYTHTPLPLDIIGADVFGAEGLFLWKTSENWQRLQTHDSRDLHALRKNEKLSISDSHSVT
jgi:hypothetical protein